MNKVWHARRALSRVVESGPALPAGADLPAGLPARDRPICAFTAAERLALGLAVLVGVDLQCDGQPRVTEDNLFARAGTPRFLSSVAVMCQVVHLDVTQVVGVADAVERADEVARLDRPTCLGGEDEPVVLPGAAGLLAVGSLSLNPQVEHSLSGR